MPTYDPQIDYYEGRDPYIDGIPSDWPDDAVFTSRVTVREAHDCPNAHRRWFYCRCNVLSWTYKVPGHLIGSDSESIYPHELNMRLLYKLHPGADFIYIGDRIDDEKIRRWAETADRLRYKGFAKMLFDQQDRDFEDGKFQVCYEPLDDEPEI